MKFTFQTAILLVVVSLLHVVVISRFLPAQSESSDATAGISASTPAGMIGPWEPSTAESSSPEPTRPDQSEVPDLADLVKDAATLLQDSEGAADESSTREGADISRVSAVNPEAETVLGRVAPELLEEAPAVEVAEAGKTDLEKAAPELSEQVAQVRPKDEASANQVKSAAADSLKLRQIAPLP
jgi:hypothetical protein